MEFGGKKRIVREGNSVVVALFHARLKMGCGRAGAQIFADWADGYRLDFVEAGILFLSTKFTEEAQGAGRGIG